MITRTLDFLPSVFQTETNKKFLNATLDQLTTSANLTPINGYVGRKSGPGFKNINEYLIEPSVERADYQLEPSVVVVDPETQQLDFHVTYPELLQKIQYYGGSIQDPNKLFSGESYSYDPKINLDAFVNFNEYYWVPNGPDAVDVFANEVDLEKTFTPNLNPTLNYYLFGSDETQVNPDITLARGGSYTFEVNQGSDGFWIQTEQGTTGFKLNDPTISTREILGITNNGASQGTITFNVPLRNDQDFYLNLPEVEFPDNLTLYATTLKFTDVYNKTLKSIVDLFDGIDGIETVEQLNNNLLVFGRVYNNIRDWVPSGIFDEDGTTFDIMGFDEPSDDLPLTLDVITNDYAITLENRYDIWQINLVSIGDGQYRFKLSYYANIPALNKITVTGGQSLRSTSWYKTSTQTLEKIPNITANLDRLYYQNGSRDGAWGYIRIVDIENNIINVENDILSRTYYTSPNGVKFTNGLKVKFDSSAQSSTYSDKEFYVDGVGKGIRLTNVDSLIVYDSDPVDITVPDYITINRSSTDFNPWSKNNRWFHQQVLFDTASYNNTNVELTQTIKARRPIIEFIPGIKLFNSGYIGLAPVDIIDEIHDRPFVSIQGQPSAYDNAGTLLEEGMRIIFTREIDVNARKKVYRVTFVDTDINTFNTAPLINLIEEPDVVVPFSSVRATQSSNNGKYFWWDGADWIEGQQKLKVNQAPRFDVYDFNGISFGDLEYYPINNSTTAFNGSTIFSYKTGTGADDKVLGFPLSYKNLITSGDIVFENTFENATFNYVIAGITYTQKIRLGALQEFSTGELRKLIPWRKITELTSQFQSIPYIYDGQDNVFRVDVQMEDSVTRKNLRVLVNFKEITADYYTITDLVGSKHDITVNPNIIKTGDRVDINFYSKSQSQLGFYIIPDNLNYNAQNFVVNEITLGQMRSHATNLAQSTVDLTGEFPGVNNSRDLDFNTGVGTILQHANPVSLPALFLSSEKYNFVDSVRYAEQEYARFKNKFLSMAVTEPYLDLESPIVAVDKILLQINSVKDDSFPWFASDMVPYGSNKNIITYYVLDTARRSYLLSEIFNPRVLSNKAVIVYYNKTQLLLNRDYEFLTTSPALKFLDNFELTVGDRITIFEYENTDGCYIPETPTKLGLWPKYTPEIFDDPTYLGGTVKMIRGHDGSVVPAFNDFRDDLLLELEKRIYNNIKVSRASTSIDIFETKPGRFRKELNRNYDLEQIELALSKNFLNWAGALGLNFTNNDIYDVNNPYTYNYGGAGDVLTGQELPGSWRACFQYFYDSEQPNLRPWEMLGFSEEPLWWQNQYGPAPYTSDNLLLWEDLEAGIVRDGVTVNVDPRFVRPGLSNIVPVDNQGNLLSPLGLLTNSYNEQDFDKPWVSGEWGRIETAWRKSANYPFACQILSAVTNPAEYFSLGAATDTYRYDEVLDQYVVQGTNRCITQNDIKINGYVDNTGTIVRGAGYINWLVDRQTSLGVVDKSQLKSFIENYSIQLSYRMAGFSDKSRIKVIAEQYSPNSLNQGVVIPDDDYKLFVNKSQPILTPTYSAIIVEKTSSGWSIRGYDISQPYFTVAIPTLSPSSYPIRVLKETVTYPTVFQNTVKDIPYGTEFKTAQEVCNFISGYERGLVSQGFKFNEFREDLGKVGDWALSIEEFLFWIQQGWSVGSILVLSPVANILEFENAATVVDRISNDPWNSKIVDQNFKTLNYDTYSVTRVGNNCKVILDNAQSMIALAKLNTVQYEHAMVFNNKSQFNDVIYDPATGQRQFRVKLVGSKTQGWTGSFEIPGFVYNKETVPSWSPGTDYRRGDLVEYKNFYYAAKDNIVANDEFRFIEWLPVDKTRIKTGLLNSFGTMAGLAENYYNIDTVTDDNIFDRYSLGLIGYRNRSYLDNLGINDASQVKFYQGFIREKGTKRAIDALRQLSFEDNTSNITLHEDWAFKVGEYGSLDTNRYIEIQLEEQYLKNNPSSLVVNDNNSIVYSGTYTSKNSVFKTSTKSLELPIFLNRNEFSDYDEDIQTVGFANVDEIDIKLFNLNGAILTQAQLDALDVGKTLWCAKNYKQVWDIYEAINPETFAVSIANSLGGQLSITTSDKHNFAKEDIILLNNIENFSGIYEIKSVTDDTSFVVEYTGSFDLTGFISAEIDFVKILKLSSIKFKYLSEVPTRKLQWAPNSKIYIENGEQEDIWSVYQKSEPWYLENTLKQSVLSDQGYLGSSLSLSGTGKFLTAGRPGTKANNIRGNVVNFSRNKNDQYIDTGAVTSNAKDLVGLGHDVASGDLIVIASAPYTKNDRGIVVIFDQDARGALTQRSIIAPPANTASLFGHSITVSSDDAWLYVGAPGDDKVHIYQFREAESNTVSYTTGQVAVSSNSFTLPFTPAGQDFLVVQDREYTYIPYRDYTLTGNILTFAFNINTAGNFGNLTVTQKSSYNYYGNISGNPNSNFGWSVATSTDGRQLVVGSPTDDADGISRSGSIDILDRSVERFYKTTSNTSFTVVSLHNLDNRNKVSVAGKIQTINVDYTIFGNTVTFITEPENGSTIEVESNNFELIQTKKGTNNVTTDDQYGYSVDICPYNCSVYVGVPYYSSDNKFEVGRVYRLLNQSRVYGHITGTVLNPIAVIGDSIRINDVVVQFTGTTLNRVVDDINNKRIPGITAVNYNGYLQIHSDTVIVADKLRILPSKHSGVGPLTYLGLDVFKNVEIIENPTATSYDRFGYTLAITETSDGLVVGSPEAKTYKETTFDVYPALANSTGESKYFTDTSQPRLEQATTYDDGSTTFNDNFESGAVWVMQYLPDSRQNIDNPGNFALTQQLIPTDINVDFSADIKFGSAIAVRGKDLFVGATQDSSAFTSPVSPQKYHGSVFYFNNETGSKGWALVESKQNRVDINSIVKVYLYNKDNNQVVHYLDYIDPIKGKILGQAEQELTYKTDYDPAVYNNSSRSDITLSQTFQWGKEQVGQLWWDLGTVRYIDYEQGTIKYRADNWGAQFEGSSIDIYEWVESDYPPAQYASLNGDGEVKYDDTYVSVNYVDPVTNLAIVKYYFWVENKISVPRTPSRKISSLTVAEYIKNPRGSGIKYLAALRDDAVALYNIFEDVISDKIILHIDYASKINQDIIHREFALLSPTGDSPSNIPQAIYNKLLDSLSGIDVYNNLVPDTSLPVQLKYGIGNRPRQSMFTKREQAIANMVEYVNSVLKQTIVTSGFDLEALSGGEPLPDIALGEYDLRCENILEFSFVNPLTTPLGYKVLVANDSSVGNRWALYENLRSDGWRLVRIQSYDISEYWEYVDWYATGYSSTTVPNFTIDATINLNDITNRLTTGDIIKIKNSGQNKWILLLVTDENLQLIGIQSGTIQFKDNLYNYEKYGYSFDTGSFENSTFEKTPTVEIRNIVEALRNNIFINELSQKFTELFFVFIHYIFNEQKLVDWAFKTSFINIIHKVANLEELPLYRRNNQDNYRQYVEEVKPYRSTIREYVFNYEKTENNNLNVSDFDVSPYYDSELALFRSPTSFATGGSAYPQDADALNAEVNSYWKNNHDYYVSEVKVIDGGAGYVDLPTITFSGSATNDDARARALVANGRVTSVIVTYPGSGYYTTPNITLSFGSNTAKLYPVLDNKTVRKIKTTLVYDRITYSSNIISWNSNTTFSENDIITFNNVAYRVGAGFTSTSLFSSENLIELDSGDFNNANDRITAYYNPSTGLPGNNLALVQSGIDYPRVLLDSPYFSESGGFDVSSNEFDEDNFDALARNEDGVFVFDEDLLDRIIDGGPPLANTAFDTSFSSNASVIEIDGGDYVDPYSSHSPEELVPGRMFDSVVMTITTANVDPLSSEYTNWYTTTGMSLAGVFIEDGGLGYTKNGTSAINVTVTSGNALVTAIITSDGILLDNLGAIVGISISQPGLRYLDNPVITVTGGNLKPAIIYPRLSRPYWEANNNVFSYRIHKSIQTYKNLPRFTEIQDGEDVYRYYRSDYVLDRTALVSDITTNSNTIVVANSEVLSLPVNTPTNRTPGVIYINGERITFWSVNIATHTLSNIRRGTLGTGVKDHSAGTVVYDMGANVDVVRAVDKGDRGNIVFTRVNVAGETFDKRFEGVDFGPSITYTFTNVQNAVRTGVFNEPGTTVSPILTESNLVIITENSLEKIAVETLANAPASNTGIFNSNTPYIRFIKGLPI
jgi:hypothetical protein